MRVGIIGVSMRAEFRDNLTNAIRYWELKRAVYNLVLAAIVIVQFCLQWRLRRRFYSSTLFSD